MKNKAQVWIGVVLTLLILGACQSASLEKKDVWVADVRSAMEQNTPFLMKDDVMGTEYIPFLSMPHQTGWDGSQWEPRLGSTGFSASLQFRFLLQF